MRKYRYVRVRDEHAEFSIVESALPHYEHCDVLDKPAADATGNPLPPKVRLRTTKASSPKGRKASETTEE